MKLIDAERTQTKLKISIQSPSGFGKTYSSLLLAFGLCKNWQKIAVIDTENNSSGLYAHIGNFKVLQLEAPFTPEAYIEAIEICEMNDIEVIVIDSISHEWNGKGGCLEMHHQEVVKMRIANAYVAWATVTPRHQAFIDAIIQSNCHIISTIRSKANYVLTERNGKIVPQKVGMAAITREGFEFEQTIALN